MLVSRTCSVFGIVVHICGKVCAISAMAFLELARHTCIVILGDISLRQEHRLCFHRCHCPGPLHDQLLNGSAQSPREGSVRKGSS